MKEHNSEFVSESEIKKEFQIERMILFSDAVFAIVITLMAIEIRIPEIKEELNQEVLLHELKNLFPVLLSYMVSFFFIGSIWYQHLKTFSLIKDYNQGLVVRNLILLFFVGLFPFSASVITRSHNASLAYFIYMGTIILCIIAQYLLQHYIINTPAIRIGNIEPEHLNELKRKRILVIGFLVAFVASTLTYLASDDPEVRSMVPLWVVPVAIVYRLMNRKLKKG
ncbi:DUF1211 domain-containing protein [Flavobacterium sp. CYK-55]|uniref:TMEM175 family protein n=1 Tax=Flavobacterium sp. CYK-55 TaxID=2835529 RepID=UPI001BCBCF64|nr:TMEM175 family protein [Flavobacterium sp. CYK-55]MBS7788176.1 DUF1211 domain-containing protein [Flavobacterium sp. CYK-55]